MKFYEPKVSLFRRTHVEEDDSFSHEYFIHVVIFCDDARCVLEESTFDKSLVNSDGKVYVDIKIGIDKSIPRLVAVKPIVYSEGLGIINTNLDNFKFKIKVNHPFEDELKERAKIQEERQELVVRNAGGGENDPDSSDAVEIDRPVGSDSVEALWKSNFNEVLKFS